MSSEANIIKKGWRSLLNKYYEKEHEIIHSQTKLNRFKWFCMLFPINQRKVVFDSYFGKGFGDNAKYIAEELHHQSPKTKIIWFVNSMKYSFPSYVKAVPRYSLRAFYESATAKAWVFNTRFSRLTSKRKEQIYLQTWHGGVPTKRIEEDAESNLSEWYINNAKEDGRVSNGIIAEGMYIEEIYKKSFWLNEKCEILCFGSPRADVFYHTRELHAIRETVRNRLGIDKNAYVVLYVPTFRKGGTTTGYIEDLESVRNSFSANHKNVVLLVRLHPNVARSSSKLNYNFTDSLIDVTRYDDAQELIIASDCGITDYSSMIFDFALMRKPGFLCMKDLETYISERGVYNLFYDLPFKKNYQESELFDTIIHFDESEYQQQLDAFFEKYPSYNKGDASKKTVEWLFSKGLR